jgi:hypothetical protein
MTARILSLRQDYKEHAGRWRALDRLGRAKYDRIKKYDAGACLAASFGGPDWSHQVMGPLLEHYLKIKKRREIWSRTRGSRQRLPTLSN